MLSFTRAAEVLQLSQPTVSQHVRRLEADAGRQLLWRDTRGVSLTDNGQAMLGFARSILAAHDEAAVYFSGAAMRGRIRFGSADDLAVTQLPAILRRFRQLYPRINLELTVAQSGSLARRLRAGHLELVYVKQESGAPEGRVVRREPYLWVAHRSLMLDPDDVVPLIAYQPPSISRAAAIGALEGAGRSWRITCNVREVSGATAAARAGLGVAVFPRTMVPEPLVPAPADWALPPLGEVDFVLLANPGAAREPVDALVNAILSSRFD